jgi:hypothetical protein
VRVAAGRSIGVGWGVRIEGSFQFLCGGFVHSLIEFLLDGQLVISQMEEYSADWAGITFGLISV